MNANGIATLCPPVREPVTQQIVDVLAAGKPSIRALSTEDVRAGLAGLRSGPVGRPTVRIQDAGLPADPRGWVQVCIVRLTNANGLLPLSLPVPGGDWMLGDRHTHDRLACEIVVGANAAGALGEVRHLPQSG